MTGRVLITCPQMQHDYPLFRDRFEDAGLVVDLPEVQQQASEEFLVEVIERYEGVIAGDDPFGPRVLERASRLKIIAKWGVGVDNIDRDFAEQRGIKVVNTPGQFGDEVADVVVGYMVMLTRGIHRIDAEVHQGGWPKPVGTSLRGKTCGVVGIGNIGAALAKRARAMEMNVIGTDISDDRLSDARSLGIDVATFAELLERSDVISLHCPLTDTTHHMLDDGAFGSMKRGAYVINTSRGGLIDESALVRALDAEIVAGAALDVFDVEPLPKTSALRRFSTCIFGSHNASNTREASVEVSRLSVENLLSALGEGS